MPNRAMAAKVARAKTEATEYAIQSSFKELTRPLHDKQMIGGKLVPRPEPKTLEQLKAEYRAKQAAIIEQRAAEIGALRGAYRSGLRDHRSLARHF